MSDEVRAERANFCWGDGDYAVQVDGGSVTDGGWSVWFGDEADAEAFIAKVNGTGLRIVDAAGNLPPRLDLTELRLAVGGALEHAELYVRGESTIEVVERSRENVIRCAINLVERHR